MGEQNRRRRATDRNHAARAGLIVVGLIAAVIFIGKADRFVADHAVAKTAQVRVHDTRTCAAVAVYTTATADDWSQRAVIARANLNLFKTTGVPDCYPELVTILGDGLDDYRWQAALDAVDAVASESYALPLACERVDSVAPSTITTGVSPLSGDLSARSQCVIGGLVFWEQQA